MKYFSTATDAVIFEEKNKMQHITEFIADSHT